MEQTMKLSLIVTLPISSVTIAYSDEIDGNIWFRVCSRINVIENLIFVYSSLYIQHCAIGILVYSYSNYRQVLAVGLSSSLSRIVCYFVFVPIYGNTGAAISFTLGVIIGFAVSAVVTKKIGMLIFWKELCTNFYYTYWNFICLGVSPSKLYFRNTCHTCSFFYNVSDLPSFI